MPTSNMSLGQLAKLAFYDEATLGVAPSAAYKGAYFYKSSLREVAPPEKDDVIGGDMNNFRDARPAVAGLSTHDGELDLPLCLNGIGDWLKLLLGAPTTTNSGSNYTHVFASGAATLPSRTIEIKAGASDFRQHIGCVAKSLKFTAKDDKGYQHMMLDLIGIGETLLTATASTGTPTARALDQMKATAFQVLYNGTAIGLLLDADWTYTTGVSPERYVDGSARISDFSLAETAEASGTIKIRYTGQSWDTIAIGETRGPLEFKAVKGANNSLSILMPSVMLGRAGVPISGPGGIEASIPFRAEQTTGGAMLAVTLKNQQTAY